MSEFEGEASLRKDQKRKRRKMEEQMSSMAR